METNEKDPKEETKYCPKCGRTLPIEDFPANRASRSGLHSYCRECRNAYQKERYNARKGGKTTPNLRKVYSNPDLAAFTPRQLMEELKARGYTGELRFMQRITI